MVATSTADLQFLSLLKQILEGQIGRRIQITSVKLPPQGVSGTFLLDARRFLFSVSDQGIRYKQEFAKLDSKEVGAAIAQLNLPSLPLSGNDAYSSAFLAAFRIDKQCDRGLGCGSTCI